LARRTRRWLVLLGLGLVATSIAGIAIGAAVGAGLAVCGFALQAMVRDLLGDPYSSRRTEVTRPAARANRTPAS
jgi:hypothetical protein